VAAARAGPQYAGADLSALSSALPQTRLSGRVDVQSSGADQPLGATLALENTLAGPWDAPLRIAGAELTLGAELQVRDRIELRSFDLRLGEAAAAGAGGQAACGQRDTLQLDMRLDAVRPQMLHGAATAASLSGPLVLSATRPALASRRRTAAGPGALSGDLQGTFDGRWTARRRRCG